MKKRIVGIAAAAVALLLLLAVVVYLAKNRRPAPTPFPDSSVTPSATQTSVSQTAATPRYLLGEWQGRLALFVPPASTPDTVYDVYVATLPEEEQVRLREGISIYDDKTLAGLIEDYTS